MVDKHGFEVRVGDRVLFTPLRRKSGGVNGNFTLSFYYVTVVSHRGGPDLVHVKVKQPTTIEAKNTWFVGLSFHARPEDIELPVAVAVARGSREHA